MAFGMDANMREHLHASLTIMIAYRRASTRMRSRGDGMHMLRTSEVISARFRILELFAFL